MKAARIPLVLALCLVGCQGDIGNLAAEDEGSASGSSSARGPGTSSDPDSPPPPFAPAGPILARLTRAQYENAMRDLLGIAALGYDLEPDNRPYNYSVIGAASSSVTELGVDLYRRAAHSLTLAAFSDATRRRALASCSGTGDLGEACLTSFIGDFGKRAWRRPLDASEVDKYRRFGVGIGLADPALALQYVAAALLESPNFLYRVELGEPDSDHAGWLRYTGYEMASRLSFLIKNTIPDAELFAAAADGRLSRTDGIAEQAKRLLGGPSPSKDLLTQLFGEYLDLPLISDKSVLTLPQEIDTTGTLPASLQAEALGMVLSHQDDYRGLFNTKSTVVDANLARLYGLTPPTALGMQPTSFPDSGPRGGILTTGAVLVLNNRVTRTAPTLRGLFVYSRLLCGTIAPPPPNIPPLEAMTSTEPQTIREKLAGHATNPACAGCHTVMDPIGLGMEDFDRYGRHRTTEDNGLPINDEGKLAGKTFHGARELGELLANDPRTPQCLVKQVYRYASARLETPEEQIVLDQIGKAFTDASYAFQPLVLALVQSDGFRYLKSEAP
jgi:hypothetical protein